MKDLWVCNTMDNCYVRYTVGEKESSKQKLSGGTLCRCNVREHAVVILVVNIILCFTFNAVNCPTGVKKWHKN